MEQKKSVSVPAWQLELIKSILFIVIIVGIVLWGVVIFMPRTSNSAIKIKNEPPKRVIGKELTVCNGREYQIIEIDGVEYISTYSGICPLVKK